MNYIMKKMLLSLLLCLAINSLKAQIFVTPSGAGTHSGADWDNAKTLAEAITAATNGDMIFVLKGTYTATSGQPLINLTGTKSGVKLYGGFAGTETVLGDRVFGTTAADSTYFVGNGSRVIYNQGTSGLPIANVIYDGFFITGGNINSVGGGMHNTYASVAVANCIFKGNKATNGTGGAIYNNYNTVNISNCKFYANTSSSNGGGIIISTSSNATVDKCIFDSNSGAGYGGGLAIYTDFDKPTTVTITNSTFTRNKTTATGGGAIGVDRAKPTFVNCSILGNEVTVSGNSGGGLFNRDTDGVKYINCLIAGNKAPNAGGGAYNINNAAYNCIPTFINCTFAGNNAPTNGGAMWNTGSNAQGFKTNAVITNCIIYGNSHGIGNSASAAATATVTYSNVQYTGVNANEADYSSGTGNLKVDPLFTNSPAYSTAPFITGDYTLQSTSPVINVGSNSAISGYTTDLLGGLRIYNNVTVDMGAYEYQGTLPVTVSSFVASLVNNHVQLKWSVGTEVNVNRYEVERSQNGIDFVKAATVSAKGLAVYSATDANPQLGINYYRLVSIDNDGSFATYKDIQTVKVTSLSTQSVQIYPNPVKGNVINLTLNGYATGNYTYKLVNTAGTTVQQGSVNYGSSNISIATSASAGVYFLYLDNGSHVIKAKLIKQ